jgi:hypothetical protein
MREFAEKMSRPFEVRYNPYTKNIEILDNKQKLLNVVNGIRSELNRLGSAINKLNVTL